jgi:hypothetical protein
MVVIFFNCSGYLVECYFADYLFIRIIIADAYHQLRGIVIAGECIGDVIEESRLRALVCLGFEVIDFAIRIHQMKREAEAFCVGGVEIGCLVGGDLTAAPITGDGELASGEPLRESLRYRVRDAIVNHRYLHIKVGDPIGLYAECLAHLIDGGSTPVIFGLPCGGILRIRV